MTGNQQKKVARHSKSGLRAEGDGFSYLRTIAELKDCLLFK